MTDKTLPQLDAVVTPVITDILLTRQAADTEDRRYTRAQIYALLSGEHFILPQVDEAATPTLAYGDGDSGDFEDSDDSISRSIAGVVQAVTGPDGKLFINTLTGVGFQGTNIISATPADIAIYAARSNTNFVSGGAIELWGGYHGGTDASGGRVALFGGGAGAGPSVGGDVLLQGGEADGTPGEVNLVGGTPTVAGNGGDVTLDGGPGFGAGARDGGDIFIRGGAAASAGSGDGGGITLTAGVAASPSGVGGPVNIAGGIGQNGVGGLVAIRGGNVSSAAAGGAVTIDGGNAGTPSGANPGGAVTITGGESNSTAIGGAVALVGGAADDVGSIATGGPATLQGGAGGASDTSVGGAVNILGGVVVATNGDGGDINLTPGAAAGSGAAGVLNVTGDMLFNNAAGPSILDEAATATNPTLIPNRANPGDGVGSAVAGSVALVANSLEADRYVGANGGVIKAPNFSTITADNVSQTQASGTPIVNSRTRLISLNSLDSATLPAVFPVNTIIEINMPDIAEDEASAAIFPALGDDLGAGVNVALVLDFGRSVTFIATAANATWEVMRQGATNLTSTFATGPEILNFAQNGDPLISIRRDQQYGWGSENVNTINLIMGGVQIDRHLHDAIGGNGVITSHAQQIVSANAGGGQGSATILVSSYTRIATVVTTGDSVRLPTVFSAMTRMAIFNGGANAADIFPASGDDLGAGVDTAVSIPVGSVFEFLGVTASSLWVQTV
jgi:hypothetical protein